MKISKKQYVYNILLERIKDGTYVPGDRILIVHLAKELGCSIIPVREALSQLEADGYIQHKPYVGSIVSAFDVTLYGETMTVLSVLEEYALTLVYGKLTADKMLRLLKKNEEMKQLIHVGKWKELEELSYQFHKKMYEDCGNSFLIERIAHHVKKIAANLHADKEVYEEHLKTSLEEHEQILTLLQEKASIQQIKETMQQYRAQVLDDIKAIAQHEELLITKH